MNGDIFRLTLRMMLGRKRTLLLVLVAGLPVLLATAFRLGAEGEDPIDWTANALFGGMIVGVFLPLVALVFGTAAFGAEAEDGTIVFILARPLARWKVVGAKLAAAIVATAALVVPSAVAASVIALGGTEGGGSLIGGITVGLTAGVVVYSAVFLCLGVLTGRAFIAGLVYVFVWEGVVTGIFRGTRNLSIREYVLGLTDGLADVPRRAFSADVSMTTSVVMMALVSAVAVWLAVRGAQRFEPGEGA
jgi:ABC-2 type transport system permease protein